MPRQAPERHSQGPSAAGFARYFAYGSNMHPRRLGARLSSARPIGARALAGYALRFHKAGKDGSAKCDAEPTGNAEDRVWGVLYEIDAAQEAVLDRVEGLGIGYRKAQVRLASAAGEGCDAFIYRALRIDAALRPFAWYKRHVVEGARAAGLPTAYVAAIERLPALPDPCAERARREFAIYQPIQGAPTFRTAD